MSPPASIIWPSSIRLFQRQLPQAEPLYRRALAVQEQTLGPTHSTVATSLNYSGHLLYQTQGQYTKLCPLYRLALLYLGAGAGSSPIPLSPPASTICISLSLVLTRDARPHGGEGVTQTGGPGIISGVVGLCTSLRYPGQGTPRPREDPLAFEEPCPWLACYDAYGAVTDWREAERER